MTKRCDVSFHLGRELIIRNNRLARRQRVDRRRLGPQNERMKKLAAIYERKGRLFVTASHRTKAGFWVDDGQVVCLSQPTHDELGGAIEQALNRSQNDVPTPPPDARIDRPLLAAAGVESWGTFMKSSQHVSVVSDRNLLKVTPHRNLGSKGGFEPEPDLAVPSATSASALGQIVANLLSRTA